MYLNKPHKITQTLNLQIIKPVSEKPVKHQFHSSLTAGVCCSNPTAVNKPCPPENSGDGWGFVCLFVLFLGLLRHELIKMRQKSLDYLKCLQKSLVPTYQEKVADTAVILEYEQSHDTSSSKLKR